MKNKRITGMLGLIALAAGATAATQDPVSQTPSSRAHTYDQRPTATSATMQNGQCIRASQVIGSSVRSSDGKTIGQVHDIVVDPRSGRIDFAVLSLSSTTAGFSDSSRAKTSTTPTTTPQSSTSYNASAAGKLVPVPWQLFSQNLMGTSSATSSSALGRGTLGGAMPLTLHIDEAKIRNAPSFDANDWSALQGSGFGQRSYAYFGLDWNNRMGAEGTAGSGVSSGVGTSSNERGDHNLGTDTNPKANTTPESRQEPKTKQPQPK